MQKAVEAPEVQFMGKFVDAPVKEPVQVPQVHKIQRGVEAPEVTPMRTGRSSDRKFAVVWMFLPALGPSQAPRRSELQRLGGGVCVRAIHVDSWCV